MDLLSSCSGKGGRTAAKQRFESCYSQFQHAATSATRQLPPTMAAGLLRLIA